MAGRYPSGHNSHKVVLVYLTSSSEKNSLSIFCTFTSSGVDMFSGLGWQNQDLGVKIDHGAKTLYVF